MSHVMHNGRALCGAPDTTTTATCRTCQVLQAMGRRIVRRSGETFETIRRGYQVSDYHADHRIHRLSDLSDMVSAAVRRDLDRAPVHLDRGDGMPWCGAYLGRRSRHPSDVSCEVCEALLDQEREQLVLNRGGPIQRPDPEDPPAEWLLIDHGYAGLIEDGPTEVEATVASWLSDVGRLEVGASLPVEDHYPRSGRWLLLWSGQAPEEGDCSCTFEGCSPDPSCPLCEGAGVVGDDPRALMLWVQVDVDTGVLCDVLVEDIQEVLEFEYRLTVKVSADELKAIRWIGNRYEVSEVLCGAVEYETLDGGAVLDLDLLAVSEALTSEGLDRVPCLDESTGLARLVFCIGPTS